MNRKYFVLSEESEVEDLDAEDKKEDKKSEDKKEDKPNKKSKKSSDEPNDYSLVDQFFKNKSYKFGEKQLNVSIYRNKGNLVVQLSYGKEKFRGIEKTTLGAIGELLEILKEKNNKFRTILLEEMLKDKVKKEAINAYKKLKKQEADEEEKAAKAKRKLGKEGVKDKLKEAGDRLSHKITKGLNKKRGEEAEKAEKKAAKLKQKIKDTSSLVRFLDENLNRDDRISIASVVDYDIQLAKRSNVKNISNDRSLLLKALMKQFGKPNWTTIKDLIQSGDMEELSEVLRDGLKKAVGNFKRSRTASASYVETAKRAPTLWVKFLTALNQSLNPKGSTFEQAPIGVLTNSSDKKLIDQTIEKVVKSTVTKLSKISTASLW
jgi:hypothetical protein